MGHDLSAWVREEFGVQVRELEPVHHGADHLAQVWQGRTDDGARYAVKVSCREVRGPTGAAALAAAGVPGVPAPLTARSGRPWDARGEQQLSIWPWVGDARPLETGMSAEQWTAYGTLLARLHGVDVAGEVGNLFDRERFEPTAAVALAREVDAVVQSDPDANDELITELVACWSGARDRVTATIDTALTIGADLRGSSTMVATHGDPHLGNLLLAGAAVWLVDWDDVLLAPPERDLLFVLDGVLPFAPVTAEQQSSFFRGYGSWEVDHTRLAYYRSVRALEDLADPARQVLDVGGHSTSEREAAMQIVRGVLSPTGLLRAT